MVTGDPLTIVTAFQSQLLYLTFLQKKKKTAFADGTSEISPEFKQHYLIFKNLWTLCVGVCVGGVYV